VVGNETMLICMWSGFDIWFDIWSNDLGFETKIRTGIRPWYFSAYFQHL